MKKYIGRPADNEGRSAMEVKTYDFLDRLGMHYETICHEAIYTMDGRGTAEKEL